MLITLTFILFGISIICSSLELTRRQLIFNNKKKYQRTLKHIEELEIELGIVEAPKLQASFSYSEDQTAKLHNMSLNGQFIDTTFSDSTFWPPLESSHFDSYDKKNKKR